jgi:hypothetical protein
MLALGPQWQWGNITLDGIPQAVLAGEEVQSYTPYTLLNQLVPFMRISRSVSRFALMVQVSMSVLSAIGLCVVLGFLARRQAGEPYAGEPHTRALNTMAPHAETLHAETLHAETLHAETLHAETLHTGEPHAAAPGESPPRAAHGANHSRTPWFAYGAGAAAILLLLAEYWVAPYPLSPPDTPPYYAQLAADPDPRAVLNLPMNYDRPGYLLYQTVHQKPLTVAYISRDDPRTLTERTPLLQHFRHLGDDIIAGDPAAVAQTVLADLDVGTVVLDRYKMPGGLEREYTEMLAQRVFGGQAPLYADERITVYRVASSLEGGAEPYLRLGPRNWGPRTINAAGAPQRALGGGPALVEVLHATTPAQVTIRYRTEGEGAGARVLPLGGDAIERALPPAPHGGEVTFTVLPPVTTAGVLGQAGLLLEPTTTGTVYIEQLRLEDQQ